MAWNEDCPDCKGTGERDSGGSQPWGAPILVRCDCDVEEINECPWCGLSGVDFRDCDPPVDYCGHDPALIRSKQ